MCKACQYDGYLVAPWNHALSTEPYSHARKSVGSNNETAIERYCNKQTNKNQSNSCQTKPRYKSVAAKVSTS